MSRVRFCQYATNAEIGTRHEGQRQKCTSRVFSTLLSVLHMNTCTTRPGSTPQALLVHQNRCSGTCGQILSTQCRTKRRSGNDKSLWSPLLKGSGADLSRKESSQLQLTFFVSNFATLMDGIHRANRRGGPFLSCRISMTSGSC